LEPDNTSALIHVSKKRKGKRRRRKKVVNALTRKTKKNKQI
jgi:hypothetical protein